MFALFLDRSARDRFLTRRALLTGFLVVGVGGAPASAQRPASSTTRPTVRPDTSTKVVSSQRKSPGRALGYSVGGTVLLLPVGGVGAVVGPAFGHFYAGNSQQAWAGIALRTGGVGAASIGGVLALGAPRVGWGLLTGGALVVIGSALYDIVTAPGSAHEYNEPHGLSAQVASTVGPRAEQVGLSLCVSF